MGSGLWDKLAAILLGSCVSRFVVFLKSVMLRSGAPASLQIKTPHRWGQERVPFAMKTHVGMVR